MVPRRRNLGDGVGRPHGEERSAEPVLGGGGLEPTELVLGIFLDRLARDAERVAEAEDAFPRLIGLEQGVPESIRRDHDSGLTPAVGRIAAPGFLGHRQSMFSHPNGIGQAPQHPDVPAFSVQNEREDPGLMGVERVDPLESGRRSFHFGVSAAGLNSASAAFAHLPGPQHH
jgi:hypothetical protein